MLETYRFPRALKIKEIGGFREDFADHFDRKWGVGRFEPQRGCGGGMDSGV